MPTPIKDTKRKDQHPNTYAQGHPNNRVRDKAGRRTWTILFVMMILYAVVFGVIYWLEPGIR